MDMKGSGQTPLRDGTEGIETAVHGTEGRIEGRALKQRSMFSATGCWVVKLAGKVARELFMEPKGRIEGRALKQQSMFSATCCWVVRLAGKVARRSCL